MKKLTRDELQQDATRLMGAHTKNIVFATVDGQYFFQKSDAQLHNGTISAGGDLNELFEFEAEKKELPAAEAVADQTSTDNSTKEKGGTKKVKEEKTPLEKAQAKVDLFTGSLEKAKTEESKAKLQAQLDEANKELEILKAAVTTGS